MLTVKKLLAVLMCVSAVSYSAVVLAHGDEKHETEKTAFGEPGKAAQVQRTLDITMGDNMRFVPDHLEVKQGETVRIRLKNTGSMAHEFVLGAAEEIAEHAELMKKFPDMKHADANSARAEVGQTAEVIWQFSNVGNFTYACLIPGHIEAGMRGTVTVVADAAMMKKPETMEKKSTSAKPAIATDDLSEGEIRKVDTAQGKMTIRHGELKNLDMPGMTMVFSVKDAAWLKQFKEGDKIRFRAEMIGNGLMVTQINSAP